MSHHLCRTKEAILADVIQRSCRLIEADLDIFEALSLFRDEDLVEAIIWDHGQCLGVVTERDLLYAVYRENGAFDSVQQRPSQGVTNVMQSRIVTLPQQAIATFEDLRRYRFPAYQLCETDPDAIATPPINAQGQTDKHDDDGKAHHDHDADHDEHHYVILLDAANQPCGLIAPEAWHLLDRWELAMLQADRQVAQAKITHQQQQAALYQHELEQHNALETLLADIARSLQTSSSLTMAIQVGIDGIRDLLGAIASWCINSVLRRSRLILTLRSRLNPYQHHAGISIFSR
ncbi:MAG: CBS domain-containing protein [Coleofasciculaceae cyanobacterium RL_1_1]|nr:CBS domain-containing protein [Coleofasciculaceae cyanobacterium RL_1_1]